MSDPITNTCEYCGSPHVLDDAWWCEAPECWEAYYREEDEQRMQYEHRTPLTLEKAISDLNQTEALVWGPHAINIERLAHQIAKLAKLPVH
jgi:hypothetical protein